MRSLPPTKSSASKKTWPPSSSSSSPPSFASPRKTSSTTITPSWQTNRLKKKIQHVHQDDTSCSSFNGDSFSTSNSSSASDLALNFRMNLFDSKAEITYLEEEDDLAALVYGVDNHSPVKKSHRSPVKQQMKDGVSGYNFSELLKDQKV